MENCHVLHFNRYMHPPRVPLGQGRSTSMPLCVCGHCMSLSSTLSQKRSGGGKDSSEGGVVVWGSAAGDLGVLLTALVPVVITVVT